MPRKGSCVLCACAAVPYVLIAATSDQGKFAYVQDVAPILKAHCASCHSGDSPSAELDLTTLGGIKRVIKAGNSAGSLLVQRLRGINGAQMPMGFAPLPKDTIDRIAAWIDDGASFGVTTGKHWAYARPIRPSIPLRGRTVSVKNPIDNFVLAGLMKQGFKPSQQAAKQTLLRRVYLDLIGIPPTGEQLDAFLADKRPDAYERVVESLLKNPHYGERMAEPWLDLSRYADTDGYEKDPNRTMWKYRDWLIDAFNRNMPYDRFTVEQLAGDLLPNPSQDQLIATGFNRNTMFNQEGGVDQEDAHFNVVLDRVNTTSTVWLGSTMQCARCHDHKYDPFTQRDYYRLAAFFANAQINPRGSKEIGEEKWFETEIQAPAPQQATRLANLKERVFELQRRMSMNQPSLDAAYRAWMSDLQTGIAWTPIRPDSAISTNGATLTVGEDGSITSSGKLPPTDDYVLTFTLPHGSEGLRIEALPDDNLPMHGPGRSGNGNFVLSTVYGVHGKKAQTERVARVIADYEQPDFGANRLLGKDTNFGWAVDGAIGRPHEIVLDLRVPPGVPYSLHMEQKWPGGNHLLGKFRLSATSAKRPTSLYLAPTLRELIGKPGSEAKFKAYFTQVTPLLDATREQLLAAQSERDMLQRQIPTALVMRDKPREGPLTAYVHSRGEFLSPTELVTAGFPVVLGGSDDTVSVTKQLRIDSSSQSSIGNSQQSVDPAPVTHINANGSVKGPALTRLDLAKWLVNKDNPLSARVEVNRLWEQFFGRGLVETSEDFGTQGARPTHPELLDWLACEFMDSGWDMRHIVRLIVMSATYRQSSTLTSQLLARDPHNDLLARGPRFRLDAETIRDNALAVAGVLNKKIGGPSVFPYQPDGVWDNPFGSQKWPMSKGGDEYRRGMYTFTKRTAPYPTFLAFDSTSRESCVVRRIRTNTPLQALEQLNDPAVFDAAKALGRKMLMEGGPTDASKLSYGFRGCTCRKPNEAELSRLGKLVGQLRARFIRNTDQAKRVAGSIEQATWTMVANVLLNLDETVTKS